MTKTRAGGAVRVTPGSRDAVRDAAGGMRVGSCTAAGVTGTVPPLCWRELLRLREALPEKYRRVSEPQEQRERPRPARWPRGRCNAGPQP